MPFRPEINQELIIDGVTYHIAEHPAALGIPYGQEGRQAIVYQLVTQDGRKCALKVFKPRYRLPGLVSLADQLTFFAELLGLQVCQRTVLIPHRHTALLHQYPDLTYAVLMPWIEGPTWVEVMLGGGDPSGHPLTPEQSLALARALAEILATMEQRGLAHCDLSGPNLILPLLTQSPASNPSSPIALVDVEQLYAPDLKRPELLPGGSPGYAHKTAPEGLWSSNADRFAGAVLISEMLGWCDGRVREAAWGENYFDPQEVQRDSDRYHTLVTVLRERWRDGVAELFERAWHSETLADCATFGEWLVTLPEEVPVVVYPPEPTGGEERPVAVRALMDLARRFEDHGKLDSTLATYRQARALAPAGSPLEQELAQIIQCLESAEAELAQLFDDTLATYHREEWAKARELLAEVVRRQPNYERGGQRAATLLARVESRLEVRATPRPWLGWLKPWAFWVLATTVGLVVGLAAGWPIGGAIGRAVGGAIGGALGGLGQWLVLRRWVRKIDWWIPTTVGGWAAGWAVGGLGQDLALHLWVTGMRRRAGWWWIRTISGGWTVGLRFDRRVGLITVEAVEDPLGLAVGLAVGGAIIGAVVALAQWLVLHRTVKGGGWWILATVVGWAVNFAALGAVGVTTVVTVIWSAGEIMASVVGLAMVGLVTGVALVLLFAQADRTDFNAS